MGNQYAQYKVMHIDLNCETTIPEKPERCHTEYFCPDCGKPVSHKGNRCRECAAKLKGETQRKCERPEKEKLLELLKDNSMTAVGKMFDVTDNTIRKWLEYYDLPHTISELKAQNYI